MRLRFASTSAFLFVGFIVAGCGGETSVEQLKRAEKLWNQGDAARAREIVTAIPQADDQWIAGQYLLGTWEANSGSMEQAIKHFAAVPRNGSDLSVKVAEIEGPWFLKNCQLANAAERMEYLVRNNPTDQQLRSTLATILVLGGRRSRADFHLMQMLREDRIELKDLVMLTQPERRPPESNDFLRCLGSDSDDAFTNFAAAKAELDAQRPDVALERVQRLVAATPTHAEGQALLGELLLDRDPQAFQTWASSLPKAVRPTPGIWFVLGLRARLRNEAQQSVRCFWEAVRLDPLNHRAVYQLGQSLSSVDADASREFARRADLLQEGATLTESVLIGEARNVNEVLRLIEILMECGRHWEANAWIDRVASRDVRERIPARTSQTLAALRGSSAPRFAPEADLAARFDFSKLPAPDLKPATKGPVSSDNSRAIRFGDEAANVGLDFTFFQPPGSRAKGVRIFESTGGGVGAIDFDNDAAPDMVLTQAEQWPLGADQPVGTAELSDRLFRQNDGRFVDVSELAAISPEDGCGQGCSAGDFDNDGFEDLYIANIGRNRLLRNNGDGTFTDVTTEAGLDISAWTTSCLIADLNNDGSPDLYDVNYLEGKLAFRVECGENECSVRSFEGAEDHVWLSSVDGSFQRVSDATPKVNSKGLGIAAIYPTPSTAPHLFIANDQVPNYYLIPRDDGGYFDEAVQRGLAVNADGRSTACMGVAAADINGDRRQDLFVTNFESEANCLYMQFDGELFTDAIRGSGLMEPGVPYVGWGTQFLDADNNQVLDLVVTNGHVADFAKPGKQYQMPLQFFQGIGQSVFTELSPATVGDLFASRILGRSIATADWNRDGAMDFAVSAVGSPMILAVNQTPQPGNSLRVALHARSTSRDAQGAAVTVICDGREHWQQLHAGDGYQASNEHVLHFGLDDETAVSEIRIDWPSGTSESFELSSINCTLDVTEGVGAFVRTF